MKARNYRKHLMAGIRERLDRETSWRRILILLNALFDAGELPA